jgi:hypothetical protein
MRRSHFFTVLVASALAASLVQAAPITIRTGQVGGAPGSCPGTDDSFHAYTPQPQCGQPILSAPFQTADFNAACAAPLAVVITPYTPVWASGLDCDPKARWIASSADPLNCSGAPASVLYCAQFEAPMGCATADSIRICWAVDDFLGDTPDYPGPNPGGIYLNGVSLGPAFSGPGADQQYSAVAYNVPINGGLNSLAVYQRDAGCGLGGLVLSATVYAGCGATPTEKRSWGSLKALYRR